MDPFFGSSQGSGPVPGPPKEPKIMAQYPKIESIGSIGSIILAILEVQVVRVRGFLHYYLSYRRHGADRSAGPHFLAVVDELCGPRRGSNELHPRSLGPPPGPAWTSKMAKIMDPILAILSILGYWAIILGSFGGPSRPPRSPQ